MCACQCSNLLSLGFILLCWPLTELHQDWVSFSQSLSWLPEHEGHPCFRKFLFTFGLWGICWKLGSIVFFVKISGPSSLMYPGLFLGNQQTICLKHWKIYQMTQLHGTKVYNLCAKISTTCYRPGMTTDQNKINYHLGNVLRFWKETNSRISLQKTVINWRSIWFGSRKFKLLNIS